MKKVCCIVNPVSGLKKSLKVFYQYKKVLENSQFEVTLFVSEYQNHIKEFTSTIDKNSFDRIIIFGGDGTINEVVNGLYYSNKLHIFDIGIIPTGSGNSVAHDINALDLDDAIKICAGNNVAKMDVNEVDFDNFSQLSVSVLGWGMFSFGNIRAEKLTRNEAVSEVNKRDHIKSKDLKIWLNYVGWTEEKFDEVLCLNKHCCAYGDPAEVLTPEVIEEMYGSQNSLLNNRAHFNNEGSGND